MSYIYMSMNVNNWLPSQQMSTVELSNEADTIQMTKKRFYYQIDLEI